MVSVYYTFPTGFPAHSGRELAHVFEQTRLGVGKQVFYDSLNERRPKFRPSRLHTGNPLVRVWRIGYTQERTITWAVAQS